MTKFKKGYDAEDQFLIGGCFGGSTEKYEAAKKKSLSKTLSWSEVAACTSILPDYDARADREIAERLGYLPHPTIVIPHATFVRALLEALDKGQLPPAKFKEQVSMHIRHIRNDDMKKFGWIDKPGYDRQDLERYKSHLPQHKEAAQKRIERYFGFRPELGYALHAELIIRDLIAMDWFTETTAFVEADYKAFTIIAYRHAVEEYGIPAADEMQLLPIHS